MPLRQPSQYHVSLSEDRLRVIAEMLLEVRFTTLREMNSPYDDNYTREATIFGRQRNRLIEMALQPNPYEWLTLGHPGMDVTFYIGGIPCRFFTEDNLESPKKDGFFKRNVVDNLFAVEDDKPVMWRFVIERNPVEPFGDRVFLTGYNVFQDPVAQWEYRSAGPVLHSVDGDVPRAVEIPPARVEAIEDPAADAAKPDVAGA